MTSSTILAFACLIIVLKASGDDEEEHEDLSTGQAWGFGILAGIAQSVMGILAALLVVALRQCISKANFKALLNVLYALGCGAMVGDSMIHILPEAYKSDEVNSNIVSLIFILAVCCFIIIERLFVVCGISHTHWAGGDESEDHDKNCPELEVNRKSGKV